MLMTVIGFILLFIDVIICTFMFNKITSKNNYKISKNILYVIIYYCCLFYRNLIDLKDINSPTISIAYSFIPFLVQITLLIFIYKIKFLKSFVFMIFYAILIIIFQSASYVLFMVFSNILNITLSEDISSIVIQLIYSIFIISLVTLNKNNLNKFYEQTVIYVENKKHFEGVFKIIGAILILVSIFLTCLTAYQQNGLNLPGTMITIMVGLFFVLILVLNYRENIVNNFKIQQLEEQERFNRIHKDFVNSINNFGHSYNNIMQTLDFAINCDEISIEELRDVFRDMLKWNDENSLTYKLKYVNIPNIIIASILSIKIKYAEDLKVNLNVEYEGAFQQININSQDLMDILNILVDNAIEAAHFADEKNVNIKLFFEENNFKCKIFNNFKTNINGEILKYGEGKGIGKKTISDILKRNKNITYNYDCNDNIYCINLDIFKNN